MATAPERQRTAQNDLRNVGLSYPWEPGNPHDPLRDNNATRKIVENSLARSGAAQTREVPNKAANELGSRELRSPMRNGPTPASVIEVPNLFHRRKVAGRSVNTLQQWEGLVEQLHDTFFTARIRDLTSNSGEEFAEIPFEEVDPAERERIMPGALFHLIIGYTKRSGAQRRETFIYFRRHLPRADQKIGKVITLLKKLCDDTE